MLRGTGTVPVLLGSTFPAGMVARWTLDDTSGGYVDLIAGRTLTAVGTAPTSAAGIIGNAAEFGGAGALATADAAYNSLAIGLAVELWARPADNNPGMLAAKDQSGAREWYMYRVSNTQIDFSAYNSGGTGFSASTMVASFSALTWTHVVLVLHTTEVRAYLNGVLAASAAFTGTPATTATDMWFGGRIFTGSPLYFTGRIDEPAIWQFGASGDPGASFWAARYNSGLGVRP